VDDQKTVAPAVVPSFGEVLRVWLRVGLLSFGGPAAQIALMHREIVEERGWLTEKQYLNALSFCMLLPGPEAMQLATYSGWRTHGLLGGLAAGLLFVLPGAFVILALASIYAAFGDVSLVNALFLGVKAAVVVIVIEALLKVSRRALKGLHHWVIAGLAFVAIFFLALPFPLIIAVVGVYGFFSGGGHVEAATEPSRETSAGGTLGTIAAWLCIWILPLLVIWALAPDSVLPDIGLFFSKLAVVTFGGAYAVLAYMAQDVVNNFGWLTAGEMMDGLGLAETTPGPLILVTEFVGFLAAFREGGWLWGIAGAAVTLWATFVPCFLWIFAGAPYIDRLSSSPRLTGALAAITAAVVGVILNLTIWFALHVMFTEVTLQYAGPVHLWTPTWETFDWRVLVLTAISAALLLWRHWGIAKTLGIASAGGLLLTALTTGF